LEENSIYILYTGSAGERGHAIRSRRPTCPCSLYLPSSRPAGRESSSEEPRDRGRRILAGTIRFHSIARELQPPGSGPASGDPSWGIRPGGQAAAGTRLRRPARKQLAKGQGEAAGRGCRAGALPEATTRRVPLVVLPGSLAAPSPTHAHPDRARRARTHSSAGAARVFLCEACIGPVFRSSFAPCAWGLGLGHARQSRG